MVPDERTVLATGGPLGSLGSWVHDAVLGGVLIPVGAMLAIGGAATLRHGPPPPTFFDVLVTLLFLGGMLGTCLSVPAWGLARLCWRVPLLAFALGPLLGAVSACVAAVGLSSSMGGPSTLRLSELQLIAAFGALTVGPPWVGYLAVRSRGRSGLPVVLGSSLWAAGSALLLVVLVELRLTVL